MAGLEVRVARDRFADLLVVDEALLDQHAPEPAAALLLLLECDLQLVLRNRLLRDEDVAEADLFPASHGRAPYEGGAVHIIRFSALRQTTTMPGSSSEQSAMQSFASQADLKPKKITFQKLSKNAYAF